MTAKTPGRPPVPDARIAEIMEKLDTFIDQYEQDMRGDNQINGGNIGMVNCVRKIKEIQERYPSLTWLLAHKPIQTLTIGLAVWLFIWGLTMVGMIQFVAAMFGLEVPVR